jgi:phosphatidylserine/phosphatidylglycerophosphate/cardiolipin synthase-like enzyme
VAFTGGLNVGDEYLLGAGLDGNPATPWRDAHVRLEGPAVAMLEAVFLESWFRADGPDRPWTGLDGPPITTPEGEAVAVIADGPTYHKRRVRDLLVAALERSRQRARLATPYFVPGRKLATALAETASRGVEVHLLLAGFTDHPLVRWAARGRLPALLASGVRAFEFERSMMHAKVAVFDSSWALIGTSNLDRQSLEHSYEVNLLVECRRASMICSRRTWPTPGRSRWPSWRGGAFWSAGATDLPPSCWRVSDSTRGVTPPGRFRALTGAGRTTVRAGGPWSSPSGVCPGVLRRCSSRGVLLP